jgi:hypothetical protein
MSESPERPPVQGKRRQPTAVEREERVEVPPPVADDAAARQRARDRSGDDD